MGDLSIKKIIVVLFGAAVILSGCSSIPEGERVQARNVPHPAEPAETVRLDSAAASVLYCPDNGEMLYGHDIHEKRAIASITKIMTAVVALESGISPDKVVNITPAMYAEGSSMYLREGEKLTLCEIIKGMMAVSGNDAANAVAITVGGSCESFADMMNKKAAKLGMRNTHFVTPSGLDDEEHYSTAYDMALLCAHAMEISAFCDIVKEKSVTVRYVYPAEKQTVLYNHNSLLSRCKGCIGIKTGYTMKAGRTLTSCVQRNGVRLIAVTLSDRNDWEDHCRLYDHGFSLVERVCLADKDKKIRLPSADKRIGETELTPEKAIYATVRKGEKKIITERITAPDIVFPSADEDHSVGTIEFLFDGKVIAGGRLVIRE